MEKLEERKERLAVALSDLERLAEQMRLKLLVGRLDLSQAIKVGDKDEVPAVVFSCDLLTAATICDMLRSYDRAHNDPATRIYINRALAWSKLADNVVLTLLIDGKVKLHPLVFTEATRMGPSPIAKVLQFKRKE